MSGHSTEERGYTRSDILVITTDIMFQLFSVLTVTWRPNKENTMYISTHVLFLLFQTICIRLLLLIIMYQTSLSDEVRTTATDENIVNDHQSPHSRQLDHQENSHFKKSSRNVTRESHLAINNSSRIPWILFNLVILLAAQYLLVNVLFTIVSTKSPVFLLCIINKLYDCERQCKEQIEGHYVCIGNIHPHHTKGCGNMTKLEKLSGQHNTTRKNISKTSLRRILNALSNDPYDYIPCSTIPKKQKDKYTWFLPSIDHIVQVRFPVYPFLDQVLVSHDTLGDMCYEMRRLMSFCGTPYPASSFRLAQSGFYSEVSGRQTRCFSCRALYSNWELMDRPDVIHRRISPDCPHLTAGDVRNIALSTRSVTEDHVHTVYGLTGEYRAARDAPDGIAPVSVTGMSVSEEQPTVACVSASATGTAIAASTASASATTSDLDISKAVYPHYRDLQSRMDSYLGWEWSHVQDPQILAAAGFYYAGYRDCVRCFYCGVGLRTWEAEDDPWVEHIRWRSSCGYVICMKGDQFIISALAQPNASSQSSSSAATSMLTASTRPSQQTSDEINTTMTVKTDKAQGNSNASQGRQSTIPVSQATSTTAPLEEPSQDPILASSLTGISSAREAKEMIQITNEHVESAGTTQKILTVENTTNNASAGSESQTHDDHQDIYQQRQLEEENQSLRDENTCKVCLDNPSCIVFLPCGHLVTCAECAPALRKCPVCRALIRGTVRAYME